MLVLFHYLREINEHTILSIARFQIKFLKSAVLILLLTSGTTVGFFIRKGFTDMHSTHGSDVAIDALNVACHICSCQEVSLYPNCSAVGQGSNQAGTLPPHSTTSLSQNKSWYSCGIPGTLCIGFTYAYKDSQMYVSH